MKRKLLAAEGGRRGPDESDPAVAARFALIALAVVSTLVIAAIAASGGARAEVPAPPAQAVAAAAPVAVVDTTTRGDRVVAYYFHTTKRCPSCRKIEASAREAVETGFPQELKEGGLVWRPVNVEEKGNEHFVKEYQLFTKAVILVEEKNGTPVRWKNLPKIWELLGDQKQFVSYVRSETRAFLAGKS